MVKISCPKCEAKKVYLLSNGKRKCSRCKYEFIPHRFPLYLTKDQRKEIITLSLLEQSSQNISLRTGLERKRILRALTLIRTALIKDVPKIFSGTVEVDESYLGGQWKNKRRVIRDRGTKRGRGTKKQPVFGILCRNGKVWAEVVDDVEAETLQPLITRKVTPGSTVCSDTWKAYTGIAAKGYVHRPVNHGERQYTDGKGNHINGLGGFGGILNGDWPLKEGSGGRNYPSILENTSGDITIETNVRKKR